jgi:hypothetical protein
MPRGTSISEGDPPSRSTEESDRCGSGSGRFGRPAKVDFWHLAKATDPDRSTPLISPSAC